jgi:hypothetical protein
MCERGKKKLEYQPKIIVSWLKFFSKATVQLDDCQSASKQQTIDDLMSKRCLLSVWCDDVRNDT